MANAVHFLHFLRMLRLSQCCTEWNEIMITASVMENRQRKCISASIIIIDYCGGACCQKPQRIYHISFLYRTSQWCGVCVCVCVWCWYTIWCHMSRIVYTHVDRLLIRPALGHSNWLRLMYFFCFLICFSARLYGNGCHGNLFIKISSVDISSWCGRSEAFSNNWDVAMHIALHVR